MIATTIKSNRKRTCRLQK